MTKKHVDWAEKQDDMVQNEIDDMRTEKIYCTSSNGYSFDGADYATKDEAIAAMTEDLENGDEFYVGVADPITKADVLGCCYNIDQELFSEQMGEEVGELGYDWLCDLNEKDWNELREIVADWLWKKDKPTFFRVEEIEKFTVKK